MRLTAKTSPVLMVSTVFQVTQVEFAGNKLAISLI